MKGTIAEVVKAAEQGERGRERGEAASGESEERREAAEQGERGEAASGESDERREGGGE
jgi:hypothetical protein